MTLGCARSIRLLWAGALALFVMSAAAGAGLRLVTGNEYPPFSDSSLPGGGLATVRVAAAFDALGEAYTIDWAPWERGFQLTLRGQYDATFPYLRTTQREAAFLYSAPLFHLKHYVYARPGDRRLGQQLADLAPGRICLPYGWAGPPEVEKLLAAGLIARESPTGHESCARMVVMGRADFIIATVEQADIALRHAGLPASALQQGKVLIGTTTLHLILPKHRPGAVELLRRFDAALATLPRNTAYDEPERVHTPRSRR